MQYGQKGAIQGENGLDLHSVQHLSPHINLSGKPWAAEKPDYS